MSVSLQRAGMFTTIVVAGGLVKLPPWCGQRFPAVGQGVNLM